LPSAQHITFTAKLEVKGGELKPVLCASDRVDPGSRCGVWFAVGDQKTHTGVLASTHTAPELVELTHTKSVGIEDHHGARVRNIDAHLDDGGRHQHINLASGKSVHHGLFVVG
jgi:hypothetical protein